MGFLDYIILLAVLASLVAAVVYMLRLKKKGRSLCCGSSGCKSGACTGCRTHETCGADHKNN